MAQNSRQFRGRKFCWKTGLPELREKNQSSNKKYKQNKIGKGKKMHFLASSQF